MCELNLNPITTLWECLHVYNYIPSSREFTFKKDLSKNALLFWDPKLSLPKGQSTKVSVFRVYQNDSHQIVLDRY